MSRWHNQYLDGHAHFCTVTVRDWMPMLVGDAVGSLYREWDTARRVLRVSVLAFVVMPDYFHIVLWSRNGVSVRQFLQRTLSVSAKEYQPRGRFWKERPRVLAVYSQEVLSTKVAYLHSNPVRSGLVEEPAAWTHSSYQQLEKGMLDVPFVCDGWDGVFS